MEQNLLFSSPNEQAPDMMLADHRGQKFSALYKNNDRLIKKHEQRRNEILINRFSKKDKLISSIRTLVADLTNEEDNGELTTTSTTTTATTTTTTTTTTLLPDSHFLDRPSLEGEAASKFFSSCNTFNLSNTHSNSNGPSINAGKSNEDARRFRNKAMLSECLVDKPSNFESEWVVKASPVGRRCLVFASKGVTTAYSRTSQFVKEFQSPLPGGNRAYLNQSKRQFAIVDCIYVEHSNTFYFMDVIVWDNHNLYELEASYRFYWLQSKYNEQVDKFTVINSRNECRFYCLNAYSATNQGIMTAMNEDPLIRQHNLQLDGLLFFHIQGPYVSGTSPLVMWLKTDGTNQTQLVCNETSQMVKTVADLPTFVTVEGYRVASYPVAGEPTLCLPQLLQYLKEKFTLTKIVEKFEESQVDFISATPKQIEGFIKASVLPSSAKSCPLIKRSDADKICLSLYEEQQLDRADNFKTAPPKSSLHQPKVKETLIGNPSQERLFEAEAQNSILMMSKAATSTLMIRVYHRCFGKCTGLYYPSILASSNPDCIECNTCHTMLSPRRFVGHVHGLREDSVCHWGFNSYNWRHYIRLSKKQTMNNLDEDELLVQFSTLRNSIDPEDKLDGLLANDLSKCEQLVAKPLAVARSSVALPLDQTNPIGLVSRLSKMPLESLVREAMKPESVVPCMADTRSPSSHSCPSTANEMMSIGRQLSVSAYIQNNHWPPTMMPSTATSVKMNRQLSGTQLPVQEVDEARRELYVRTNLVPYLNEKGLSAGLTEDIVHQTIIIMRKSRAELY